MKLQCWSSKTIFKIWGWAHNNAPFSFVWKRLAPFFFLLYILLGEIHMRYMYTKRSLKSVLFFYGVTIMKRFAATVKLGGGITQESLGEVINQAEICNAGSISEVRFEGGTCSLQICSERFEVLGDMLGWFKDQFSGLVGDKISMREI